VNLDADVGLAILADNLEGEVLDVVLDGLVAPLLANETFLLHSQFPSIRAAGCWGTYDVEDGPVGVRGELILGRISDKTLVVRESYPRRSDTVTCKGQLLVWLW
jgi:hypothetical protein